MAESLKYRRVLLKFSGEVLRDGKTGECISSDVVMAMANKVKAAVDLGCEVAIVLGGGNIFRGATGALAGIDRSSGDYMGMLATIINALALQNGLEKVGLPTRVMTAIDMPRVAEPMILRRALRHLEKGRVVIFAGGTGNPYFSTDTGAALRASEIHADAILKATKVDGVYTADPKKDSGARRYEALSYRTALDKRLKVMDSTAFAMCMDNRIPIIVFDFFDEAALERVITGQPGAGTIVADVEDSLSM
ncbi:MAG: UMP kinase [Kiritimatiellae bacterium]|jgi:uridylate kinase|nr:UMP kinase [Kiritimatiellia bacterium]MBR4611335.1 UMP kinase [Kiritimatiellia bacterium]